MSKHTPGPYRVTIEGPGRKYMFIRESRTDRSILAEVNRFGRSADEVAATAALFAAAPDMLVALQTIALHAPSLDVASIRELCDAAISRATSSPES